MMLTGGNNAKETIVCDVGAYQFRGGYAGDATPVAFPTTLGYVFDSDHGEGAEGAKGTSSDMESNSMLGGKRRAIVGSESLNAPRDGMTVRPVFSSGGLVDDWGGYEQLWLHFFGLEGDGLLGAKSEDNNIIVAEQPFAPPKDREKICEMLFEKFRSPSVSFIKTSALGAFATGRTSALTVDVGHSVVTSCAVQDGFFLRNTIAKSDFAGRDLSEAVIDLMRKKKQNLNLYPTHLLNNSFDELSFHRTFTSYHVLETSQRVKEALCYVSKLSPFENPTGEQSNSDKGAKSYKLPDGTDLIFSNKELSSVPEMLFTSPGFGGRFSRVEPLSKLIYKSIQYCKNVDFGRSLWGNIVLIGGSSVYENMVERLSSELSPLTAQSLLVKVVAGKPQDRKIAAWLGGSIIGSLPSHDLKMTKSDYVEHGVSYIHECCP